MEIDIALHLWLLHCLRILEHMLFIFEESPVQNIIKIIRNIRSKCLQNPLDIHNLKNVYRNYRCVCIHLVKIICQVKRKGFNKTPCYWKRYLPTKFPRIIFQSLPDAYYKKWQWQRTDRTWMKLGVLVDPNETKDHDHIPQMVMFSLHLRFHQYW